MGATGYAGSSFIFILGVTLRHPQVSVSVSPPCQRGQKGMVPPQGPQKEWKQGKGSTSGYEGGADTLIHVTSFFFKKNSGGLAGRSKWGLSN